MSSPQTQFDGIAIYRRLLTHVYPYWKVFSLAVAGMAIYATTDAGFAYLMRPLLDDSFVNKDPATIKWVPIAIIGVFLIRAVSAFFANFGMTWVARNTIRDLRGRMFSQLLQLPISFYDNSSSGVLISKIIYDVEQLGQAASMVITILIRDSLTIAALLGLMFYTSVTLTLVFVTVAPFITILVIFVSRRFRKLSLRIQQSMGNVSHITQETIEGNRVIKIFGGQDYETKQFSQINEYNRRQQLKHAATNAFSVPFIELMVASSFALIVYMATLPEMLDFISPGTFISFMTAMLLLMQPIKRLTTINANLQQGIAAAQSIFKFLDEPAEQDKNTHLLTKIQGAVEFSSVNFSYAKDKSKVLNNINFSISPGQTVAFVGHSGGGKSTLVSLLPRFYELTSGTISIEGHDISTIQLNSLRAQIALVSQHITLFNDTIEHNIAYGALEKANKENIIRAAQAAHAMEFIDKLPEGLNTIVGENGVLLSGGQRQRIAIARALLKNAPVLILDEATAALDTESEWHIQKALEALMLNRTTLVIAHRLSTIEHADKIIVIHDGQIVETGKHAQLLTKNGYYADLYNMQFRSQISE